MNAITRTKKALVLQNTYTISEIIRLYRTTIKNPEKNRKYLSYPKGFLQYCIEKKVSLSDMALQAYLKEKSFGKSIKSVLKRFLQFCKENSIFTAITDPQIKAKANKYVLLFLASVDLKSQKSKRSYLIALNQFYNFLQKRNLAFSLIAVNQYLQHLISEGKSSFTINQYLSAIKKYVQWILNEDFITKEFTALQAKELVKILDIKAMRIKKGTYWKDSLDKKQRDLILENTEDLKEKIILSLQAYEGLRPSEPAKIRLKDIDFERKTLKVQGKGKHTQDEIKIFGISLGLLKKYVETEGITKPDAFLFPKLQYWQVYNIFRKALKRAGLDKSNLKLSPHSLRHTACQVLTIEGVRPEYVQKQMRHSDISTTQIYLEKIKEKRFITELPDLV